MDTTKPQHTPGIIREAYETIVTAAGDEFESLLNVNDEWADERALELGEAFEHAHSIWQQLAAFEPMREALAELIDQLECIGIPDWHGAEGLSLEQARAALALAESEE